MTALTSKLHILSNVQPAIKDSYFTCGQNWAHNKHLEKIW